MREMWQKVLDYGRYIWKAIVALLVPIVWAGLVELVEGLQGTFVENPYVVAALTALAVFLKSNGPKPT